MFDVFFVVWTFHVGGRSRTPDYHIGTDTQTAFVTNSDSPASSWLPRASMTTRWSDESASASYSNFQGIYRGVAVSAAERACATSG